MISKKNLVLSTDSYEEDSIKAQERKRRGISQPHLDGTSNRIPADRKLFLQNDVNKKQPFHLLLGVWNGKAVAAWLEGCTMAVVVVGVAHLAAADGEVSSEIHNLCSSQVCFLLCHMIPEVVLINAMILLYAICIIVLKVDSRFVVREESSGTKI